VAAGALIGGEAARVFHRNSKRVPGRNWFPVDSHYQHAQDSAPNGKFRNVNKDSRLPCAQAKNQSPSCRFAFKPFCKQLFLCAEIEGSPHRAHDKQLNLLD
jgi:hypothetical protein